MKIIALTLLFMANSYASTYQSIQEKIITDPSISRRCDELIEKRKSKIKHRQRLTYLLEHSKKLRSQTPENKKSIDKKLYNSMLEIIGELKITNLKISSIEETIIRRGCPGISL